MGRPVAEEHLQRTLFTAVRRTAVTMPAIRAARAALAQTADELAARGSGLVVVE